MLSLVLMNVYIVISPSELHLLIFLINGCDLIDIDTCRLDQALCNQPLLDSWLKISCYDLMRHHSNHNQVVFCMDNSVVSGPRPFQFYSIWIMLDDFLILLSDFGLIFW